MKKHKQIGRRIMTAFLIVSVLTLLFTAAFFEFGMLRIRNLVVQSNQTIGETSAEYTQSVLTQQALENMSQYSEATADIIDLELTPITQSLRFLCDYTSNLYSNPQQFGPAPYQHPQNSPSNVNTMQWVLSPGMSIDDASTREETYLHGHLESLYASVMQENPSIISIYITTATGINSGYDASSNKKPEYYEGREEPWYTGAKNSGELTVSDTYFDSFDRGYMVTMSMPVYTEDDEFVAVIALDMQVDDLGQEILQTTMGKDGYSMLFSDDGNIIFAPEPATEDNKSAHPAEYWLGNATEAILSEIQADNTTFIQSKKDGEDFFFFCTPILLTRWSLVMALPMADMLSAAELARTTISDITKTSVVEVDKQILFTNFFLLFLVLLLVVGVVVATRVVSHKITQPILQLNQGVRKITAGNWDYVLDIQTKDEIESLAIQFNAMTKSLQEHISTLTRVTADKERLATELAVATQIQTSMLPCIFPPFPQRHEFELHAYMQAAKEVGGDFYDFFLVDEQHLAVVVADVSGKGVPAALFMVITKTLIKNHAQAGLPPAKVFETVNRQLCESNDAEMFVTAFLGVLNVETGVFTYVNAGHNPPFVASCGEPYKLLATKPGFVLAGLEQMKYTQSAITLMPGDEIFMYTDGVTEALNPQLEEYTTPRLQQFLNDELASRDAVMKPTEKLLENVRKDIDAFVQEAEQADDITLLSLRYYGEKGQAND